MISIAEVANDEDLVYVNGGFPSSDGSGDVVTAVAPMITGQPGDQVVNEGETATFRVSAEGTGPLTYQWLKFGAELLGETGSRRVQPYIHRLGYIQPDDMPYLYGLATLFLYPSLRESFGLPIIEAMAASTPVITSSRASMPEIAGNAALLADPERPEEITRLIRILASDVDLRNQLRQRGRERARRFSWYSAAHKLRSIYRQIGEQSTTALAA